jgi:hypothetical protein
MAVTAYGIVHCWQHTIMHGMQLYHVAASKLLAALGTLCWHLMQEDLL